MKILAFIPARGGSKGIIGKNLHPVAGKPLLYYTIDIAKQLGDLVLPFLSTDDKKIKEYANSLGLTDEYLRPEILATDTSSTLDAVLHGVDWYERENKTAIDAVLLLQPTSPIRKLEELKEAILFFEKEKLSSLVSVTVMREHPFECIESDTSGWSFLAKPKQEVSGRQSYTGKYYFLDGSFYIASLSFLKEKRAFVREGETFLFESKLKYSIDIDEIEDLEIAESILKKKEDK
ncbi:cytidylyltransferase domain-containing protein [Leptospira perdikensis]|uniref:Acylneuraminate cytidylyltransferase family protein n=1 Tax=Leptospira perdikensis TaxID=2484948 RepID=A0A4R9JNB8_9LEPT|nr:acylneuraminate cytidylyltransferase family protein [Leptospira perdikensis]TGL45834.1 acylneuraminate cytidylyltransferase family protein [Leptospira perdikensis]